MLKCQEKLRKEYGSTLTPDFSFKFLLASFFLILLLAGCAERKPRIIEPRVMFQDPLRFVDAPADEQYNKAYAYYQSGNLQKARTEFEEKLVKTPNHYPSYLGLGYIYLAERDWKQAATYIRKALEIHPDYPQAHFALGYTLEQLQDYDAAFNELNEVARLQPDYPSIAESLSVMKLKATETHLNEARQLEESDPDEAIRHLKAAQLFAPDLAEIPAHIAKILFRQDKCEDAVPYLQKATEQAPDNTEVKRQLADCYRILKQYEQALPIYETLAAAGADAQNQELQGIIDDLRKKIYVEGLPQEYQEIPNAPQITRAQFAALLAVNLEFLQKYSSSTAHILVDTIGHWAKNFILKAVNLGIMDSYPNRTFQPNQPLSRLELAKGASRILEILESNEGKRITTSSNVNISDVPGDNVYYPMIAKAVSAGVVSLDGDGGFHPNRSVSGAEALSVVNRLKQIAE
jgi:tetratricopeptide (TPR) repeat protein